MQAVADTEIRSEIRSLLVRHRVDLWRLQVRITSGTVRVTGELNYLGGSHDAPTMLVENLEREVGRTRGVKRAYLDFSNWSRLTSGEWQPLEQVNTGKLTITV